MAIHVDVIAELERRSIQKAADELERKFDKLGVDIVPKVDDGQARIEAAKLQMKFNNIHADVKVDVDHAGIARATRAMDSFSRSSRGATSEIAEMGTQAFQTGRGIATQLGAPIAALIALDFASWAITATGALGMIPAAATAAAAGIGTLALATDGFGKAIGDIRDPKKFAADLQLLSPASQQAALSIQNLLPAFDRLKHATQDAFFAGIGEQIHNLANTYLPQVQSLTTGIAASFNQMMTSVSTHLMTPETQTQVQTIFSNIGVMFQNLVPSAQSFSQAFIDIVEVGSNLLPGFGTSISEMAQNFANFIREARNSGQLREWIQNGIDAVKMLGTELWNIGSVIVDVFGSNPKEAIANFKDDLEGVRQVIALLGGDFSIVGNDISSEWSQVTDTWKDRWDTAINFVIDKLNTFIDQINTIPGLGRLFPDIKHIEKGFTGGGGNFGGDPNAPSPTHGGWGWNTTPGRNGSPPIPNAPPGLGNSLFQPAGPGNAGLGPYGGPFAVPAAPGPPGSKPSDRERLDAIRAGLDPSLYHVDPFAPVPGMPSPGALAGGPMPGGGYGAASGQDFFEGQQQIINQAHQLEEKRKDRLALERDNQSTAEQINDAKWQEHQAEVDLQKAQAALVDKTKGTAQDLKTSTEALSAGLDPDLGLSKGLAGLADNLVRFAGHMALAGPMAQMNQIKQQNEQATGISGGYGLFGISGAQNLSQGLSPLLGNPLNGTGTGTTTAPTLGSAVGNIATGGGDAAILSHVPATGTYSSTAKDLSLGLADCSSAVEDLVNIMDGRSTTGGSLTTGNAAQLLPGMGFQRGMGGPGDMRIGYNSGHMQATLPGGTPFNYGAESTIDKGGVGGQGADDPSLTDHWFRPAGAGGMPAASTGGLGGGGVVPVYVTNMGGGGLGIGGGAPSANHGLVAGGATTAGGAGLGAGTAGGGAESWRNTVRGVIAQYGPRAGITADNAQAWEDAIVKQIDTESKGDPGAANPNDSNGRGGTQSVAGLLQYLPSSYASSGGQLTGLPYMDPVGQIAGALMAPRTASGAPDVTAPGGIGAGHGWGPTATPLSGGIPAVGGGTAGGPGPSMNLGTGLGTGPPPGPIQYGGVEPPSNPGGGGMGITPGGTVDSAIQMAASAFPGVGQAAATGMKLANRAIQYGGQMAGIGVEGLMQTFLPTGGSELASNSWLTRLVGGLAGASPALPNIAGKQTAAAQQQGQGPLTPQQVTSGGQGPGLGGALGAPITINYANNGATEDRAGADIAHHIAQQNQPNAVAGHR